MRTRRSAKWIGLVAGVAAVGTLGACGGSSAEAEAKAQALYDECGQNENAPLDLDGQEVSYTHMGDDFMDGVLLVVTVECMTDHTGMPGGADANFDEESRWDGWEYRPEVGPNGEPVFVFRAR